MAAQEQIQRAAQRLIEAGATAVYLFGSAATGKATADSDVDMAVSGLPPEQFFRAMSLAGRELDCDLDLVDLDTVTPFTRYLREHDELTRLG